MESVKTESSADESVQDVVLMTESQKLNKEIKNRIFRIKKQCDVHVAYPQLADSKREITVIGKSKEKVELAKKRIVDALDAPLKPRVRRPMATITVGTQTSLKIAVVDKDATPAKDATDRKSSPRKRFSRYNSRMGQRNPLTHFISIPFTKPVIRSQFLEFKKQVQEKFPEIEDSLFQNPSRIHLTCGVMSLNTEQEAEAAKLLPLVNDKVAEILKEPGQKLKVSMKGISFLGPEAKKCRVIFAELHSDYLVEVTKSVVKLFEEKKLLDRRSFHDGDTKLHVTLMNTTFRTRRSEKSRESKDQRRPSRFFDGSGIIESFKDFVFVEDLEVDEIHVSCFKSESEDNFYTALEKLHL